MASKGDILRRAAAKQELGRATQSEKARLIAHARTLRQAAVWPGTDIQVGIKVLSQSELQEAQAAAMKALREIGINDGRPDPNHLPQIGAEVALQILARALFETEAPDAARLFSSAAELAGAATNDELNALFDLYEDHRQEVEPTVEELPEEEFQAFVEAVKKKEELAWRSTVSSWPRAWLRTTAARLATSANSNSPNTASASESPETE